MVHNTSKTSKVVALAGAALLTLSACGGGETEAEEEDVITVGLAGGVPYS